MQISQPQSEKYLGNQAANNEIGCMMGVQSNQQVVDNFNNTGHKSKEYYCVIKLGKVSMVSNLVGLVIIFFYLMIYYALISVNWNQNYTIPTILCIIADVLLLMQISVFFYSIINKSRLMNLSISINFISILLKILAIIVLVSNEIENDQKNILIFIPPLIMAILQAAQETLYIIIVQKWIVVPEKKWKKQMVLVKKQQLQSPKIISTI